MILLPDPWGWRIERSEAEGGEGLVGAAGLAWIRASRDQVGTGQELQGCGDFWRYKHYPGTNIFSLLLGSSKEIVSRAAAYTISSLAASDSSTQRLQEKVCLGVGELRRGVS